jgi:tripartite-type tricarboxylate transporter receptor subunit TctC
MKQGWLGALVAAAMVGLAGIASDATAQNYPNRPVRVILPFPPGGAVDAVARPIGQRFQELTGQAFVIDNRPGAGGNLGPELAANAPADGYTLLLAPTSGYAIATALYPKLNYDLMRDFAPLGLVAGNPHVLVVHPSVPANNVQELIALAKSKPGQLTMASQGVGTVSHLEGEMLRAMTGVDWLHVPYKGSTPALADLTGGQVNAFFDSIAASKPHVLAGRTRALGVTPAQRTKGWPEIPTIAEQGVPGYAAVTWFAMFAPAATPKDVTAMLARTLVTILNEPATAEKILAAGIEPTSSTPEQLTENIKSEIAKWAPLVKASGAKPE